MASVIKNAAAGQSKAMTALYEANKNTVYTLARCLLAEETAAAAATVAAFRDIWAGLKDAKLHTEADFTAFAVLKTAEHCKKLLLQKSPKALRTPHGKDFRLPANLQLKAGEGTLGALANLPPLQRYILVLHRIGQLSTLQIGKLLQMDPDVIESAFATEEETLALLEKRTGCRFETPVELTIPADTDAACLEVVADLAAAAKKTNRSQILFKNVIYGVIAACVLALLVALAIGIFSKEKPDNTVYYADIVIEGHGTITVKLDRNAAPATVDNFVKLANSGFYNGLTFHRIMEGFMMQGGCPYGNGSGDSGTNVVGEFSANGYTNNLSHTRGAISMARSDEMNSGSSQFFIVHQDSTFLDGQYACFGYVTSGMEIVDTICTEATPTNDNGSIPADQQPIITSITIRTQ